MEDKRATQQFEFIELVLAYEGVVTNQHIREQFGIASVQASRVIAAYRHAHSDNISRVVGEGRGRYAPSARFEAKVATLSVDRYFDIVTNEGDRVEDIRMDLTSVDPALFRVFHQAMKDGSAVRVTYRSMSHPKGRERVLHPKSFVFAGRRWHVRAFDELSCEHRDFNLARVCEATLSETDVTPPIDSDWEEYVDLLLRPHPLLTHDQDQLIRDELLGGAAGRRVKTRRALIGYVLRELEIAEKPDEQRPPEYQLSLLRIE